MLKLAKIERRESEERRSKTKERDREKMAKKTKFDEKRDARLCIPDAIFSSKGGEEVGLTKAIQNDMKEKQHL